MRKMKDFFKQRGFWLLLACTLLAVLSAWRFDANPPENAMQGFADTMIDIMFDVIAQIINAELVGRFFPDSGAGCRLPDPGQPALLAVRQRVCAIPVVPLSR